jgi:hypothetical protein
MATNVLSVAQPDLADVSRATQKINNYPFSQVREKILMEASIPAGLVDEAIDEFRKYFCLIARGNASIGMLSPHVDEVWHTFILFTEDYAAFCADVFGRFIHHRPHLLSQPVGSESGEQFVRAYEEVYGELPAVWGDRTSCGSCDTKPS